MNSYFSTNHLSIAAQWCLASRIITASCKPLEAQPTECASKGLTTEAFLRQAGLAREDELEAYSLQGAQLSHLEPPDGYTRGSASYIAFQKQTKSIYSRFYDVFQLGPTSRPSDRFFRDVLAGERQLKNSNDADLFIEAICVQQPATLCVERIMSKPVGLETIRKSVRCDLTPGFIQRSVLKLVGFLSDPSIKSLNNGQFLHDFVLAIVDPPTVWKAMTGLFLERNLLEESLQSFAWLVCEIVSMPPYPDVDLLDEVKAIVDDGGLTNASEHEVRAYGYRIKHAIHSKCTSGTSADAFSPGGRHDNDFEDFRNISIYPTPDEFLSTELPFYRRMNEVFEVHEDGREGAHLDNQFRLLREDMLGELRNDVHVNMTNKQGPGRRLTTLGQLQPLGVGHGDAERPKACSLALACYQGLGVFRDKSVPATLKYLKDNPRFLRHDAFGVLSNGKTIFGFAFLDRDETRLTRSPPVILLRFVNSASLARALLAFKSERDVSFTLVNTPVFAYEPVLKGLKAINTLPLSRQLLLPQTSVSTFQPQGSVRSILDRLRAGRHPDGSLTLPSTILDTRLDKSQADSLLGALERELTQIQGPPGTGKSFLGALIVKILAAAGLRVLVVSYTNHALDQFLIDLNKTGIEWTSMVRLGSPSKCHAETINITLGAPGNKARLSGGSCNMLNHHKQQVSRLVPKLHGAFHRYKSFSPTWDVVSEHLEFSDTDRDFHNAFRVPAEEGGWSRAGKNQKKAGPDYLYKAWSRGGGPGIFAHLVHDSWTHVWEMSTQARQAKITKWMEVLTKEHVIAVESLAAELDEHQSRRDNIFCEGKVDVLKLKQVIGCTTTSAAKQSDLIRNSKVDVVLVEEAGEILESHVLTALSPSVKQVILIGDHKQLRPKVNNYALTVEKGEGFNLNMSLFERLIVQGAPHTTLLKQHRMSPEISLFVRELTYPDLVDDDKTKTRELVRGLRDRVVFFNHARQEEIEDALADRRDPDVKASKKNDFEAEVVLSCVKYFIQQGYTSDQIVVLTPYLGQLRLLRDRLKTRAGVDPLLNDMDSAELIRAGLTTQAAAKVSAKPLRISTIDNYQGEESEIVIGSLTRSNESGDIGFMAAPERLNVLLSRARNCMVLVGNMGTFMQSKKGQNTWVPFFELLKRENNLYDGLPIKCEQHPETTALLKEPADFETFCSDGGCSEPCGELLMCKTHKCKRRCHRIRDHSNVECTELVDAVCSRRHKRRVQCSKKNATCAKCVQEDKEIERRAKRDLQLEKDRLARQAAYKKELQDIEDDLDLQRRLLKYEAEEDEQVQTLEERRAEAATLKETVQRTKERKAQKKKSETKQASRQPSESTAQSSPAVQALPGTARFEWEQLKTQEGARSKTLDELMGMIGLEDVKKQFLSVKFKVDTILRQNSSLKSERFSCSLLGNPGTGKTTVARLYGSFLNSCGVIPGSRFEETTGSRLANMGVTSCKDLLDDILNDGGGVLFIDEAYQLSSGSNAGGAAVLDFLLAEVENLTGKVVFILAGYQKQMESFFAHNPGFSSRFPREFKFADYTDDELHRIFELKLRSEYNGSMNCEDGLSGLYTSIVARRIGYGRGTDGFGNARAVENTLSKIGDRQADRLRRERQKGPTPDDFLFTKEDLIGPEPSGALAGCDAWTKLQGMIGLGSVRTAIQSLVDTLTENYRRELRREPIVQYSLNRVFLGNPGTGKTTVAKLLGAILCHLGLLSKGEVLVKNPSDFVGAHLGQSEQQTKGILAAAVGKVLVIDEAYGLFPGGSGSGDPYKTAVIDTIVAEVQSVPGDDRAVILCGYRSQMENMFQNVNPGLSRRFPLASAFVFEDFTDNELQQILCLKLKQQGFEASGQSKAVVKDMLNRARNRPNFGNAGEIDVLLDAAKARHQTRLSKGETKCQKSLEPLDFDENFDRADRAETNIRKLFEGTVGAEDVIAKLEGYQDNAKTMKLLGMDPKETVPFSFLFRGPPGTGKTTTAKKIGKVFYDMGFLATPKVIECSASEIIGQYVGQTAPKVRQMFDKALGRVLFIDEAYRLCDGAFGKEAIDEMVDAMTKDTYHKRLIIILAGYENQINSLMSVNPGLPSRFPGLIDFRAFSPTEGFDLLCKLLEKQRDILATKGHQLDLSRLIAPTDAFKVEVLQWFTRLVGQDQWASARDVQTVARGVFNATIQGAQKGITLAVEERVVVSELKSLFDERASQSSSAGSWTVAHDTPGSLAPRDTLSQLPSQVSTSTTSATKINTQTRPDDAQKAPPPPSKEPPVTRKHKTQACSPPQRKARRDTGVSDEVWEQLQRDQEAEVAREEEYQALRRSLKDAAEAARELIIGGLLAEEEEERKRQEEERKRQEALREKITRQLLAAEQRREREAEARKELAARGLCPAGFAWIAQSGGWRCKGGSHFVPDGQLQGMYRE